MAIKPAAKRWAVKEQIVQDAVSGLTLQFTVSNAPDAPFRLRITGDLPFGNREILFNADGEEAGSGVALTGSCSRD
jgi:hypothetical protein